MPVRRVRRCWSSPLQGEATPFSPSAGCGPLSWSITASHAMTVSAYMRVRSPLDGGGLYALRAGRCGCDSLSLAGSRQRVKSLRSSERLRLVFYTARSILSRSVFRCAPHTSSEGSQKSETGPYAIAPVTDSPEVSLSGWMCPDSRFVAAVSSLVTQRLSAFRSFLAPAYRLCCAPRLSAESSEPSSRQLLRR